MGPAKSDIESVRDRYYRFAREECQDYSESYFELSQEIAGEERLLRFLAEMPDTQPNLFLAVLQYLTGLPRMPCSAEEVRKLVEERRDQVIQLMQTRRTQTNEPARCTAILPALPPGPLALIEVGASAGLCLLLDKYAYRYNNVELGPPFSTVRLSCHTTGAPPLPDSLPKVVWRSGLDLNPLDVNNDDDVRWLLALIWPEHQERRTRLVDCIKLARNEKLNLHRGNLASDLPALIAEAPADATLVVFHTAVLVYANDEERFDFAESLAEASRKRDIVWISNENAGVILEISALAPPVKPSQKLLGRTTFRNRVRQDELLGITHLHGAELEWLAD